MIEKFVTRESKLVDLIARINVHCKPGRLTNCVIEIPDLNEHDINDILLEHSAIHFAGLRKLKLYSQQTLLSTVWNKFIRTVLDAALNLNFLHLFKVNIDGAWLIEPQILPSLHELQINKPHRISEVRLASFLRRLPDLKIFTYRCCTDVFPVGTILGRHCNLAVFEFSFEPISCPQNTLDFVRSQYDFLTSFDSLTIFTMTSYTTCSWDLHPIFKKLAAINTVTHLKVIFNLEFALSIRANEREDTLKSCYFSHFFSLEIPSKSDL